MAERSVRAGVVGLGTAAAHTAREIQTSPHFDLYAGADIDPEARERFGAVFPNAKVYESIEQLAADPEVEVGLVLTPSRLHAEHAIILANAGKHVVVEKPMAISLKEAEEMVEVADRHG